MIKVINPRRTLVIPPADKIVGWFGDNMVDEKKITIERYQNGVDLYDFSFKLDTEMYYVDHGVLTKYQQESIKNIIDLTKEINPSDPGEIILTWIVLESHLLYPGQMAIQVRGFTEGLERWHSSVETVMVKPSINAETSIPMPLPGAFSEIEAAASIAKDQAVSAAAQVVYSAEAALGSEQSALGYKNQAQGYAEAAEATIANVPSLVKTIIDEDRTYTINLFNKKKVVEKKYIDKNTGLLGESASRNTSDFIRVEAGEIYTISSLRTFMFYDKNKNKISGAQLGDITYNYSVTAPAGTEYLRFDYYYVLSGLEQTVVKGSIMPTEYVPYGYTMDSLIIVNDDYVANTRGVCFSINNVDLATTQSVAITAPYALTITGGKLEVGTAPTGAALICDVHLNGTTLWSTQGNRPTIEADGTSAAITAPDVTSIAQGDRLELQIDQVGSTVAGKDLSLTLYCEVA